ncbi:hypothetical protein POTOM_060747 [Populus tomentosa]|uniref:Protein kinase domain-containing protein n=1 Tax=Populus tomentosa TaxID=118781 RepID=A0A8X8C1R4_POPTO|nr:hypothetical protein POTOM_060747 [Populus tomentosa]
MNLGETGDGFNFLIKDKNHADAILLSIFIFFFFLYFRDIKCANLLVDANGSVKLADFGLAKVLFSSSYFNLVSCFLEGTAFWMAPEVCTTSVLNCSVAASDFAEIIYDFCHRGLEPVTWVGYGGESRFEGVNLLGWGFHFLIFEESKHALWNPVLHQILILIFVLQVVNNKNQGYGLPADIWSLGCTVLEMLTRQIPYSELESMQALFRIGRGVPPLVPDSLSNDARDFILQCLQVNPNDRPTAAMLLDHPFMKRPLPAFSGSASPYIGRRL